MESVRDRVAGTRRRFPFGAEPDGEGRVLFRVWAPGAKVALELLDDGEETAAVVSLEPEAEGYGSATVDGVAPGTLYRYRLNDGPAYPDPASRHQPHGPHGPSAVVDPGAFAWTDGAWRGVPERPGPVVYELHVGTFTPEGTWSAAAAHLPHLVDLGVSVVQMMPLAEFGGAFGWGYDGVLPFAPFHGYGEPDDLRAFVDAAHGLGLAVILDVVYNHLGAEGNYLGAFSPDYMSRRHTTDWGDALNYDGPNSPHVRAYVLGNVRYWIEEFHFDGFRFDATQEIHDDGADHVLHALVREARAAAGDRRVLLLGENEPQDRSLIVSQEQGGAGLDGIGNDDFHHAMAVALTGRREGYFSNHHGSPQELVSALKRGFLYQGQWYPWQRQRRGTSTRGLPMRAIVHYLENHDQVANRPGGARLHTVAGPGAWRAAVAVQLLAPQTPLLFQGQEFASSAPFFYFADNPPEVARNAREGRAAFLAQFRDLATPEAQAGVAEPADPETFRRSKLDWKEREAHGWAVALHRDLLRLRTADPTFSAGSGIELDGAVLGPEAFVIRWWGRAADGSADRLMLVNLGPDLSLDAAPEPLLAPPADHAWRLLWSSQDVRYGGPGTPPVKENAWHLPATSAVVLEAGGAEERDPLHDPVPWDDGESPDWAPLLEREWLVTNGLGGYASGTVSGAATRRYHGLLIAAHPPPLGRILTLADMVEEIDTGDGAPVRLGGEERADALELHGARHLVAFRLDHGLPVWTYELGARRLEKRLMLLDGRNTALVLYRLVKGEPLDLRLRPMVRFRQHDVPVDRPLEDVYSVVEEADGIRVTGPEGFPELRIRLPEGGDFEHDPRVLPEFLYRIEATRGYGSVGDTWSPGAWRGRLEAGRDVVVVASTEGPDEVAAPEDAATLLEAELRRRDGLVAAAHPAARSGRGPELVIAADSFLVRPLRARRTVDEEERSVIAGYHWFTDWGRDTMISLEGLTLVTGRHAEARRILRTFATRVRDGLIPNLFPEGSEEGLYHTADATLWFFHALERYVTVTGDRDTARELLPVLRDIVEAHLRGTRFGIGVDPSDGLLRQGAEGYQLTWMDAKVDGWVVTPRRGKAVEINALWYNALRVLEGWEREEGDAARAAELTDAAERARASFNERFWIGEERGLYDVVDGEQGDDDAFRPNQIFSVALPHPVLDPSRWEPVVLAVRERLLTPVGLRSLAPDHPDYRSTYFGDLRTRDAAYHQGTVWSWLIGPFVDAWLRVRPDDRATARRFLQGLLDHLDEFGVGSVAEVFDGDPPHRPRGCIAQAWGVAELLRCLVRTTE